MTWQTCGSPAPEPDTSPTFTTYTAAVRDHAKDPDTVARALIGAAAVVAVTWISRKVMK